MSVRQQTQAIRAFFAWRDGPDVTNVESLPISGQIDVYETHLLTLERDLAIREVVAFLDDAEWDHPKKVREAIALVRAKLEGVL